MSRFLYSRQGLNKNAAVANKVIRFDELLTNS